MKNLLLPLIAFVLGFTGVAGYQYFKSKQVAVTIVQPQPEADQPLAGTFALVPPSQAVSGILTITGGHAKKLSRTDTEYKEASSGAQILLGESIATENNSSADASVNGIVKTTLGSLSELVFANMFPQNFVLQQKNGKIEYVATQPVSIRALHALISVTPGDVIVTIIDSDLSVTVKSGSVKLALVDHDNNTKIWDLTTGQRANVDDTTREVFLIKAR